MTAQRELLDSVREICSLPSFKALADRLNVPRQNVHQWLTDERPIPDERIAQLCAMAHIDAPRWLARIHAERAESAVERRAWLSILERLRPAAAVAGLAMTLLLSVGAGHASDAQGVGIMRSRRLIARLARALHARRSLTITEAPHGPSAMLA